MCYMNIIVNLKKLNYVPVGLGKNNFSSEWLRDNKDINISEKILIMVNTLLLVLEKYFEYLKIIWISLQDTISLDNNNKFHLVQ